MVNNGSKLRIDNNLNSCRNKNSKGGGGCQVQLNTAFETCERCTTSHGQALTFPFIDPVEKEQYFVYFSSVLLNGIVCLIASTDI